MQQTTNQPEPEKEKGYTTCEAAVYFGRVPRTIRLWCVNGTLLAANCRVERQKLGGWIIYIPHSA